MKLARMSIGLFCALCTALAIAAEPVQEAEYLDKNGNRVSILTYDDGSLRVMTNDGVFAGAEAIPYLSAHGIVLDVNLSGHIMGHTLASQVVTVIKPRPVTKDLSLRDEAKRSARESSKILTDALPSNVGSSTAFETQRYYESAMHRTTGSDTPKRDPVSAR